MGTVRKITKLILQYISGFIFAYGLGMWGLWGIYYLFFLKKLDPDHDGAAYSVFGLFFFFGIPLAGSLGIFLISKIILRLNGLPLIKILIGFIGGVFGSMLVYWILPFLGVEIFGWFPTVGDIAPFGGFESFLLISTLFALIGYNTVVLFAHKKQMGY